MSTLRFLARYGRRVHFSLPAPRLARTVIHANTPLSSSTICLRNHTISHWSPAAGACQANVQWRCHFSTKGSPDRAGKSDAKSSAALAESDLFGDANKLGLFAKFKLMYKKYWYVLIPVHCVTSAAWFGGFYYMSSSGVDVASLLEHLHVSETIIQKVQGSHMGHLAIAYLCYKLATPLRYAVTLGGTTFSIKYLVQAGHIKPMPSKQEFMQMYEDKKASRAAIKAEKDAAENAETSDKSCRKHK